MRSSGVQNFTGTPATSMVIAWARASWATIEERYAALLAG
jgi:hypothetical protein